MKGKARLIEGPVGRRLFFLTVPMVGGIFAITTFNLVDTFFVAQLGTDELAAMGFIFPVVMFVQSIALGLGIGTASVVSRAIGEGDHRKVRRLTTDSLILAVLLVVVFVTVGLLTINPLFTLMGATPEILPLIREYMTIWYVGMIFVTVPMV
jgi:Na+-driven multidrug efflux pump